MKKVDELQARYPNVVIEEHEKTYRISESRGSAENVNKDNPDLERILFYLNLKNAIKAMLEAEYPYLYFSIGDIPGYSHPNQYGITPQACCVWLRRLYDYGEKSLGVQAIDGTATGFTFLYPPDEKVNTKLIKLNEEARLASQDGWFFCTQCHKAYPKSEYGGYWFATTLCNKCATPEWKRRAAAETYE